MPEEVKDIFGKQIDDAQTGVFPEGARPFGEGLPADVLKLVVNEHGETYRCAFVAAFQGVIYVAPCIPEEIEIGNPDAEGAQASGPRPVQGGETALRAEQGHLRYRCGRSAEIQALTQSE